MIFKGIWVIFRYIYMESELINLGFFWDWEIMDFMVLVRELFYFGKSWEWLWVVNAWRIDRRCCEEVIEGLFDGVALVLGRGIDYEQKGFVNC